MDPTIITKITAIYAAVVSTATAAWTIYKDWNDTGKLRVTAGFRSLAGDGNIEDNILVWHITNAGKRSVLLTHAAASVDPSQGYEAFLVNDPQLPRRLEPGDYHMTLCRQFDLQNLTRLYAIDSLNRNFDAPDNDIAEVNKKLRELAAKGIAKSTIRRRGQ